MVWGLQMPSGHMCTANGRQRKAESAGSVVRRGDSACSSVSPGGVDLKRRSAVVSTDSLHVEESQADAASPILPSRWQQFSFWLRQGFEIANGHLLGLRWYP